MSPFNKSIYLVTDDTIMDFDTLYNKIELALQEGIGLLQLREKKSSSKIFYAHGLKIKALCEKYNVPLIINDRLDIAQAIDADGVHLGQSDLPLTVARKILGPKKMIGISANTVETALDAQKNGADYIGVGAIFPTSTKNDAILVPQNVLLDIQAALSIPIVAIGGINSENAASIINLGVDSIAVVSAILAQDDPKKATQCLNNLFRLV